MTNFGMYYGNPSEFTPVNAAYLQLSEELEDSLVMDMCDYTLSKYGRELGASQLEDAFQEFDIDYPSLRQWNKDRIDDIFDVY